MYLPKKKKKGCFIANSIVFDITQTRNNPMSTNSRANKLVYSYSEMLYNYENEHRKETGLHMDTTRWSTPKSNWLYSLQPKMEKLYRVRKNKTENWLWFHHQLIIAKFRLNLKKVGKNTRPFRYDLNQIPYDYTVEVRNRFKGLDLTECLKNNGQRFATLYRRWCPKPFSRKRNIRSQSGCLRRPYK